MECKIEEDLLVLPDLWIARGLVDRFKPCSHAKLSTARISYTSSGGTRSILLSSIIGCKLKNCILYNVICLECTDDLYYLRCKDKVHETYQALVGALKTYTSFNVIEHSESLGGISRLTRMKEERIESVNQLRRNAMNDLRSLKHMSRRLMETAKRLKVKENPLSNTLKILNIDPFSDGTTADDQRSEVKHIMLALLDKNGLLLLSDLFCAVNRMRLCNLITPAELREEIEALQGEGVCRIVELKGVAAILSDNLLVSSELIMDLVSKGPVTVSHFAEVHNISINMAEYILLYAQLEGIITRDDGGHEIMYYHNPFI